MVPTKKVKLYANSRPWVTITNIKQLLVKKHKMYQNGTEIEKQNIMKEVGSEIMKAKFTYKTTWHGMRSMAHCKGKGESPIRLDRFSSDKNLAEALDHFYLRFEKPISPLSVPSTVSETVNVFFDSADIKNSLSKSKPNKSPGPDFISGRLLNMHTAT